MSIPLRVLIIEDSVEDTELLVRELRRGGYKPNYRRVDTPEDMGSALADQEWDIIFADYSMPRFTGDDALAMVRGSGLDVPFIFVSGTIGEDVAVAAMKAGAQDYVMKGNLKRLTPAIEREVREARLRREKARAEERLHKLSLAVEQSSNIIIITDAEGIIEYVNPKFTEVTGYSAEEVVGHSPALISSGLTASQKYKELSKMPAAGGDWHGEFLNRKKNGELFWCEEHIAPIRNASGKVTHFVAVENDVTERHKTAEQLQKAQKMETAGWLAGGIAHDFNNFLMVVHGNLELLREKLVGQSEACDLTDNALHATDRSAKLVRQLLAFSRQQSLQPQAVDVCALIGRLWGLLGSMLIETISLRVSVPDRPWCAFVDQAQLENALLNLAINARDAMPRGGTLLIKAENVELTSDRLPVGSEVRPGSFVRISVADTGTGMPPEVLERALEPFFTTKEVGKGSGLGLSMVYGFIKQSGGHIEIDSAPGRGTRVDLYLRETEPEEMAEAPKSEATALGRAEIILVVEDNPELREVTVSLLEELGYRSIAAPNGPAALAVLESKQNIDLLFTDIVMPSGMTGIELARKALSLRPGIKLLFATGHADGVDPTGVATEMSGEVLTKPYRKNDLARAVRDALKTPASLCNGLPAV